ncbi:START domain protein (macronuclear) [Tetrahymena thermophila SB210]|uniref:START domain protein n=1 Tax=Tetrahymena thermophila (strain SB210) TaxID=312017 RepID=I7M318_TETTS|nr:START domain protein [Tetrahymena thermophila SB210]EAS01975.1 START domain protein [Tetrahymena thermophila SB210]|eukprot:XP_001022220.1 START domain protein [Tetrahymena thermophila SB210]
MENTYQNITQATLNEVQEVRAKITDWKELKKGKHLVIYNTQYKDYSLKLTKVIGTIPTNIQKVATYFFSNIDVQRANRSEMLTQLNVVEQIDENSYIILSKTKSKMLVSSRENINVVRKIQLSANEIVIVRSNVDTHHKVVISKDSVQSQTKLFGLFLTKVDENNTKIEVYNLVDPKGSIPSSITNGFADMQLNALEKDIEALLKL